MNAPVVADDVGSYIAEVERLFDDLPDAERRELLDDVREHVTEVAAEDEGSLVERLGPPDVYAAELRAAAGLPVYVPREELSATDRLRRRLERSPLAAVTNSAPARLVRGFMPELRPAWWVIRGFLAAVIISAVVLGGRPIEGPPWPTVDGSWVAGLLLIAVCVALSIVAGRATLNKQRWLGLALAANVAIVALFLGAVGRDSSVPTASVHMVNAEAFGYLQHGDGAPITHICAYDEDGKRIKDVQLFDQMGRPIELGRGKLDIIMDKVGDDMPRLKRKLRQIEPDAEAFECPKLEDLRSKRVVEGDRGPAPLRRKLPAPRS